MKLNEVFQSIISSLSLIELHIVTLVGITFKYKEIVRTLFVGYVTFTSNMITYDNNCHIHL